MSFINNLPVLIVVLPLSASLLCMFLSMINRKLGKILVTVALLAAFACAVSVFITSLRLEDPIHFAIGEWTAPIGIEFVIDPLNALLACFILFLSFCTAIYALPHMHQASWLHSDGFYTLIGLLTVGLCGMTLTGDVFNLYVYLEISSLSCYGLVALGGKRSVMSSFRYLLVGTIGASFYLMGIGIIYSMTGSLNMADISVLLQGQMDSPLMVLVCVSLIAAFGIKMAIFPFHLWQPDAYAYSHPAASPLISGIMSKIPALAMIRFFFFIFGINHVIVQHATFIVGIIGAIGMVYGSVMAMAQNDFRRMLAYSSIAQLGYVALGIGMGNLYGVTGSYLHILNHVFMKGGLFFAIGCIQYKMGVFTLDKFGGLYKKMPLTCMTLVIGALSMVGIPPTGGFFSKWYLLLGAMEGKYYVYIAVLIVSTLLNAVYFLRMIEKIFIAKDAEIEPKREVKGRLELPINMLIPVVIFGLGIIVLGFMNSTIVENVAMNVLKGVL